MKIGFAHGCIMARHLSRYEYFQQLQLVKCLLSHVLCLRSHVSCQRIMFSCAMVALYATFVLMPLWLHSAAAVDTGAGALMRPFVILVIVQLHAAAQNIECVGLNECTQTSARTRSAPAPTTAKIAP